MEEGTVVGSRFTIERLASSGGMGAVYRAHDAETGAPVALKILLGRRSPERFLREARLLADLDHPAIVRYVAHGVSEDDGAHWIAMEWLDGEDLADRLARKPLTRGETLALARRAAEALAHAHARGLVHRDLKPSNLFLVDGDIAKTKLLDFGVARAAVSSRAGTATGSLLGTPGYMAPEQALGEREIDARADVFSLGCVIFECLTGRPPFVADTFLGLLAKIVLEDAPRTRELRADVPPKLDDLVARMLAKDRERRPKDGAAALAKLEGLGEMPPEELPRSSSASAPSSGFARPRIGDREQRLVSVVLAGGEARDRAGALALTVDASTATRSVDVVRRAVAPYGARFEGLADGSLAAALAGGGTVADQAAQAARCALAIRAQLADVPIVLATGRSVVAGKLPVGEVIDRATRTLARAEDDARKRPRPIRLDEVTAGLLDARFEVGGDAAGLFLVGEKEPHAPPRALLGRPTPCVGRERELRELVAIFDQCVEEPVARAVLVTAAAGVGKSRLREELVHAIEGRAEVWVARGDPMSAGSPFSLLAQAVRRAAGLKDGEPAEARRQRLRARVARHVPENDQARVAEFLGELVAAPFPESVLLHAARQDPVLMGDQMRRAWEDFVLAECAARPLLLVLEDLHWGDLPTVRFVDGALRALADRPLFVLALARPDVHALFPRLWAERRTQEIRLEELGKKASERLVREVLGELGREQVDGIVHRAAGNAFYLEELIRAVAEGKGDALPETVLAMAQARLDALDPEERRILRAASVFGDTFWRGGIVALLGGDRATAEVDPALGELARREVITRRADARFDGEVEYAFRHALVREAAYASLTASDARLGHELAAKWLRKMGEHDAMVLAEHTERGGAPRAAVPFYLEAALHALRGNDFAAAIARAERGAACGAAGEELGRLALVQAEAHRWAGSFAEAARCGAIALEALRPKTTIWYLAAGELASAAGLVGDRARLVALARELAAAEDPDDAVVIATARAAVQLAHAGERGLAEELVARADRAAGARPSPRGWVLRARMILARVPYETRRCAEASIDAFDAAGDARTACLQRMNLGYALIELGEHARAEAILREALAFAARIGLHHVTAPGMSFLGNALLGQGKLEEASSAEREAIALFAAQGDKRMEAVSRDHLARARLAAGDADAALAEARAAIALCDGNPAMRATVSATLAAALLANGDAGGAIAAAREGMAVLEERGAIDQGEARLRLAFVRALDAAGDREAALEALDAARARIEESAAAIPEAAARATFLERVPENDQTFALARAWGADRRTLLR